MNNDIVIEKFNPKDLFKQEFYIHDKTLIYIKDHMRLSININQVIQNIESMIPEYIMNNIDDIFIGQFQELKKKNIEVLYKEGALYIDNEYQINNESLIYCIMLGIGYSIISINRDHFLNDGMVLNEFFKKRIMLCGLLKHYLDNNILNIEYMLNSTHYYRLENIISHMRESNKKEKQILNILKDTYVTNFGIYSIDNYIIDSYIDYFYPKAIPNSNIGIYKSHLLCPQLYSRIYNLFHHDLKQKGENKYVAKSKSKYSSA